MADENGATVYERHLEDWVCDHIHAVLEHDAARVVGRQFTLPHGGRADVIAIRPVPGSCPDIFVVEVKRNEATPSALTQLLRYMGDLTISTDTMPWHEFYESNEPPWATLPSIKGLVVAPEMSEAARLAMLALTNVSFFKLPQSRVGWTRWDIVPDHSPSREQCARVFDSLVRA